jgi:hypothetical protein
MESADGLRYSQAPAVPRANSEQKWRKRPFFNPSTTGQKIYCECHFLLTITANYCPCTVSADNYCSLLCLLLSVLRITVIYCPCTVGTANYCHLLSLSIASREPWNCPSGWIHKVSGLYTNNFFFKIISFKLHFLFLASRDNYNDTKHYMCILEN